MKKLYLMTVALLAGLAFTGCQTQQGDQTEMKEERSMAPTNGVLYETELMKVTKQHLSGEAVGQPITYKINVMAKKNITNVQVTEQVSDAFAFISSTPTASQQDGLYVWNLGTIKEGSSKAIQITVEPNTRGINKVCSTFTADPILCLPLSAGMPELTIAKTGPGAAELGETVTWDVTVTNVGDVTAPQVVLTDTLPEGFTAVGPTEFQLGDMAPGQSKTVQVSATTGDTGNFTNTAATQYSGSEPITDDAPIQIVQSKVAIEKTGPEESYAFVNERFEIKVNNIGQTRLDNLVVTDRLPPNTQVSNAGGGTYTAGADGTGGTITWNLGSLDAGQTRTVSFVMTSTLPARTTNVADVVTGRGLRASDTAETLWKAVPGIRTSIYDDNDPIRVGETTTYYIDLKNQSRLEVIQAELDLSFSGEVKPIAVIEGGQGTINGQNVNFANLRLEPGQEVRIRISAEGAKSGAATVQMSTSTNFRTEPIRDEESTTVY